MHSLVSESKFTCEVHGFPEPFSSNLGVSAGQFGENLTFSMQSFCSYFAPGNVRLSITELFAREKLLLIVTIILFISF